MSTEDTRGELVRQRDQAWQLARRGLTLLVLIPVVATVAISVVLAVDSLAAFVVGALYVIVSGLFGVSYVIVGVAKRRTANAALRAHDEQYQLPQARVIER